MEGTESGDAAVKVEAQKLRADNTFLAEELCFTAQQVLELHAKLQKALPQESAVEFGNPGAYVGNLKLQDPRPRLREMQPTLRRYNFVLENLDELDDVEENDKNKDSTGIFPVKYRVRTSFSCLDKNELMGWGAFPAPVGTEAAAKGVHKEAGLARPSMGYYEVLIPASKDGAQMQKANSKKQDFARFSYTDWSLINVADAQPGTTIDVGSMVKWIGEAEPRTPDDALPLFLVCKDALKNIASGLLDFRNTREIELEQQVKKLVEQRDEAVTRADGMHAQCEHLQQMIATFEIQTQDMQKRLDEFTSGGREQEFIAKYDAEVSKTKQLESEASLIKAAMGKLSDAIRLKEEENREAAAVYEKKLSISVTEKVECMCEDELLQHVLTVFQQKIPWARLGPEIIAKQTELATLHSFCKIIIQRLRAESRSWVSDLCALLEQTPKDFPLALTKWYEAESLLKLTPALNKEIKDLARNVRKKDFNMIWDVLRESLGAGTMSMESLIFHVSGKSKDDVLKSWTGIEPDALNKLLACREDFDRWLARKEVDNWKQQRRHDRLIYLSFLDFSTVRTLHAHPPPTDELNAVICHILELKRQWDDACRRRGRPPLSLMRVTRAYFFHTYGIRSAAELHLAEFLAGILLHQHRLQREDEMREEWEDTNHDTYHVSYRVLLFASLLRVDDASKWREQTAQFIISFIVQIRLVTMRLRNVMNERDARGSEVDGSILDANAPLSQVLGSCDFLLPSAEVISLASSPEVMALMPEAGRNIAHIIRESSDSANPPLRRKPSMREQESQKLLLNSEDERSAFNERETKRLEAHQRGLKYIVATGDTGCVWVDHLLYLLAEQWHKTNEAVETARKANFAKFSQDADGRMDLGDFASLMKVVSPSMGEYDVAHLFMELVDSHGKVDADEWLQVLSLYEAGLAGGGGTFLPDEPTTFLDHSPNAGHKTDDEFLGQANRKSDARAHRDTKQAAMEHSHTLPDLLHPGK